MRWRGTRTGPYAGSSTRDAFVVVLRAEAFQELDRFRIGLRPLDRSVRHVDRRLSGTVDERDGGALRNEVLNHLVIAPCRGVVERGVAVRVAGVDVGLKLLDEELDGLEHAGRREAVRVGGEPFAVA